jgi:uncharacterized surface protein with fasciclin (FAS1) repeats
MSNLTAVTGALNTTDMVDSLDMRSDVTVFAPTNEAFMAVGWALSSVST